MLNMTYKNIHKEGYDREDTAAIMSEMRDSNDFEYGNCRFISDLEIDNAIRDELTDPYMLGCFNAWFLASILGIPTESVEAIQKAEQFEALGHMVLADPDKLKELQEAYVSADGYGHHFASYDGNEAEIWTNDTFWHVFRVN